MASLRHLGTILGTYISGLSYGTIDEIAANGDRCCIQEHESTLMSAQGGGFLFFFFLDEL